MKKIDFFHGEYKFLSNFYPCEIPMGEYVFPSVENAYQACKVQTGYDLTEFTLCTAGQSKRMMKLPNPKYPYKPKWDMIKVGTMDFLLFLKFSIPELKDMLLSTGDVYLEEGNTWGDTFWGVCNGVGKNTLGILLMHHRKRLNKTGFDI